jgi:YVTN family beta-propeller protein
LWSTLSWVQSAQAGSTVSPALYTRDLAIDHVAAAAAQIGSLHGIDTHALARRFTALARAQETNAAGPTGTGQLVTTTNWSVTPAGTQTNLGDLPVNAVLSPDGAHLLIVNSGAGIQSVQVIDTSSSGVIQTIPYSAPNGAFIGAAYSPNGKSAYVAGGGQNVVHFFTVGGDGMLTANGDLSLGPSTGAPTNNDPYPAGLSVSRDGKLLYVANSFSNTVDVIDTVKQALVKQVPVGQFPYTTLVDPSSGRIFVSNWNDATVSVIDPLSNAVLATIPVGAHPTGMAFGTYGRLYVADANADAISVIDTLGLHEIRRFSVLGYRNAPFGSSPQSLTVDVHRSTLYVANAGNNAIAVFSLRPDGSGEVFQGWIPTAWYPTSVTLNADNSRLFVTNGYGLGETPNNTNLFPNPTRANPPIVGGVNGFNDKYCNCTYDQFTGTMDIGTLSTIPLPSRAEMIGDTLQVFINDHYLDISPTDRDANNPVPLPGGTSPIKHVIYIIKENRTYDQVFGDEPAGNGDPSLTLFGKSVTPNLHALAERFGLIDNFYADAQVSADGHNWILSANASDYDEKLWPQNYSAAPGRNYPYTFESALGVVQSPGGYLWDNAAVANVSYRTYGEYTNFGGGPTTAVVQPSNLSCTGPSTTVYLGVTIPAGDVACFPPTTVNPTTAPNLVGHIDAQFPPYDTNYPDMQRFANWKQEFDQYVANDNLPALELVRFSQDHTRGTNVGQWTAQSMVSDNDAAVGALVDAVSHSKYWASTAIFVTEDDAQNGPDHVDSHRTEALVISPYTSQATSRAIHIHYDTSAMVRTIELLLGLKPMSQYDATAMPMWQVFSGTPDMTPYNAIPESVPLAFNTPQTFGAKLSAKMNFTLPDEAPAGTLNQILWHSIKGAKTPYPQTPGASGSGAPPASFILGSLAQKSLDRAGLGGSSVRVIVLHRSAPHLGAHGRARR